MKGRAEYNDVSLRGISVATCHLSRTPHSLVPQHRDFSRLSPTGQAQIPLLLSNADYESLQQARYDLQEIPVVALVPASQEQF